MCSRLVRIPSLSVGRSPFGPSITRCMLLCVRRGQNSSPCSSSCSPRTSMHLPTKEPIFEQGSRQAAGSDPLLGFCDVWPPALLRMTLLQASTHLVRARARVMVRARQGGFQASTHRPPHHGACLVIGQTQSTPLAEHCRVAHCCRFRKRGTQVRAVWLVGVGVRVRVRVGFSCDILGDLFARIRELAKHPRRLAVHTHVMAP